LVPVPGGCIRAGVVVAFVEGLEALLRSGSVGIAVLDRELRYVAINEALAARDGASIAAHLGRAAAEMIRSSERAQIIPKLHAALATGQPESLRVTDGDREARIDLLPNLCGITMLVTEPWARSAAQSRLSARLEVSRLVSELSTGFIRLPAANIEE